MRFGLGLNARRVPMQFQLIKNQGALRAQQCVTSAPALTESLPHEEFHGAIYFSLRYHLQPTPRDSINCQRPHLCKYGGHTWMFTMQNHFVQCKCILGERAAHLYVRYVQKANAAVYLDPQSNYIFQEKEKSHQRCTIRNVFSVK